MEFYVFIRDVLDGLGVGTTQTQRMRFRSLLFANFVEGQAQWDFALVPEQGSRCEAILHRLSFRIFLANHSYQNNDPEWITR